MALSGVSAPSGWTAPHAVASSNEERGATVERDDCKSKRRAHPEAEDSSVSSVITSSIPKVRSAGMVSVVVFAFANMPG